MKIPLPRNSNPGSQADWSDVADLQRRLMESADELSSMAPTLAQSRVVREFDSDRRKRILAVNMIALIKAGESAAKAEAEARSLPTYLAALDQLAKELTAAEEVIANWECAKVRWESCRSLLSMSRETMKTL